MYEFTYYSVINCQVNKNIIENFMIITLFIIRTSLNIIINIVVTVVTESQKKSKVMQQGQIKLYSNIVIVSV